LYEILKKKRVCIDNYLINHSHNDIISLSMYLNDADSLDLNDAVNSIIKYALFYHCFFLIS